MEKLISVRHYCFVLGVTGRNPDSDFRQAFRTLNRLYVEVCDRVDGNSGIRKPLVLRRKAA
jgi:hypothetical protein